MMSGLPSTPAGSVFEAAWQVLPAALPYAVLASLLYLVTLLVRRVLGQGYRP
jgi:hypothetical protein